MSVSGEKPTPDPAEEMRSFRHNIPRASHLTQDGSERSRLSCSLRGWKKGADDRRGRALSAHGQLHVLLDRKHPVEMLLPMYHLDTAGFAFDVATVSGNPVKFEYWAMPSEDAEVKGLFAKYHPRFKQPMKLSEVIGNGLDDYVAVIVPGSHGTLIGLPESAALYRPRILRHPIAMRPAGSCPSGRVGTGLASGVRAARSASFRCRSAGRSIRARRRSSTVRKIVIQSRFSLSVRMNRSAQPLPSGARMKAGEDVAPSQAISFWKSRDMYWLP